MILYSTNLDSNIFNNCNEKLLIVGFSPHSVSISDSNGATLPFLQEILQFTKNDCISRFPIHAHVSKSISFFLSDALLLNSTFSEVTKIPIWGTGSNLYGLYTVAQLCLPISPYGTRTCAPSSRSSEPTRWQN